MQAAPEPKSALGRHRLLSPSAGVMVSPLTLGTMNFGDAWYHSLVPSLHRPFPSALSLTPLQGKLHGRHDEERSL